MVLFGELSLRAAFPDKVPKARTPVQIEVAFEPHPVYLISLKPNLERTFRRSAKNGQVITHWNTNSASFRGPEIKEKHGTRIIVYGDSNIFARFSNLEDTFPFQLQEVLRRATGKTIEVINAGVPGFGPDQSLLRFE
jgi:hypothetical protein